MAVTESGVTAVTAFGGFTGLGKFIVLDCENASCQYQTEWRLFCNMTLRKKTVWAILITNGEYKEIFNEGLVGIRANLWLHIISRRPQEICQLIEI